jgi:CPA2 family monovalent cation:H+ antiporter-2
MNGLIWSICLLSLITLGMVFLLKKFNLPYLIAYIIAGIVLGPSFSGVFTKPDEIEVVGEIGILLLMFFLGMEINVPDSRSLLTKPIIAQSLNTF